MGDDGLGAAGSGRTADDHDSNPAQHPPSTTTATRAHADQGTADRPVAGPRRQHRRQHRHRHRRQRRQLPLWQELPILLVVAVALALVIKTFLVQAFYIPSGSMEQTLHGCPGCRGDRVLVNKLIYDFRQPRRGEIIVFNGVDSWAPEAAVPPPANPVQHAVRAVAGGLGLGAANEEDFIKRVIGLPGDTVACCDARGRVTVNGRPLTEPYIYQNTPLPDRKFGPVTVPRGRLWVMGDHRLVSADSRAHIADPWHGTIPESHVVGRAFAIVWPPGRMAGLPVPDSLGRHS